MPVRAPGQNALNERVHPTHMNFLKRYKCKDCNKSEESVEKLKNHECGNYEVEKNSKCEPCKSHWVCLGGWVGGDGVCKVIFSHEEARNKF